MSEAPPVTPSPDSPKATLPPAELDNRSRVLFHDLVVLQLKLLISGWLHFLLSPATLMAVFLDLISKSERSRFYRVLEWGHRAEEALGLFAVLEGNGEVPRSEAAASTTGTLPH